MSLAHGPPYSGVEGHDSCFLMLANATGVGVDFWQAEADCVSRGGHLLSTLQTTRYQGGLLDATYATFPHTEIYIGGYR